MWISVATYIDAVDVTEGKNYIICKLIQSPSVLHHMIIKQGWHDLNLLKTPISLTTCLQITTVAKHKGIWAED